MRSRYIRLIVAFAISVFFLSAIGMAQKKAGDLKIEPYVFETGDKAKVDAEFGRLLVPENRSRPDSRLIELAFVRFKSTSPEPGSPIVYLAGGPGGSGIGTARGSRFPLFMAMREIGDMIAFDQRGTGSSRPNVGCTEAYSFPPSQALTKNGAIQRVRELARQCATKLNQQGVDLAGYSTNESADDIEDLRKALGAEKVSLWGISYGTHLALATIKRHEKSIDRAILAGVEGPQHTAKLPSTIQKHLQHLDSMLKADAEISKEIPSLVALMKTVLDGLERKPVTIELTDPKTNKKTDVVLSKFAVQMLTAFSFGSGESSIPAVYYAMSKGDYSIPARLWFGFASGAQNIGSGMSFMMDCYSGDSTARRTQITAEERTTLLGDVMNFPFPDVCDVWGDPDLGDAFRKNPTTKIPTLFISGTLDVRTPVSNAEEVRKGFSNSSHLIIDGAAHSDPLFLSSPKIKDVMLEFMKGKKLSTTRIALDPFRFAPLRK